MNKNNTKEATDFKKYLNFQLKNKKFKENFDEFGKQLEVAYEVAKTRKLLKMSQLELAKKIGTTQSNVARLESGQQNVTINFLHKVSQALNRELKIILK